MNIEQPLDDYVVINEQSLDGQWNFQQRNDLVWLSCCSRDKAVYSARACTNYAKACKLHHHEEFLQVQKDKEHRITCHDFSCILRSMPCIILWWQTWQPLQNFGSCKNSQACVNAWQSADITEPIYKWRHHFWEIQMNHWRPVELNFQIRGCSQMTSSFWGGLFSQN